MLTNLRLRKDLLRIDRGRKVLWALPVTTQVGVMRNGEVGVVKAPEGLHRCGIEDPKEPGKLLCVALYTYPDDFTLPRAVLVRA